MRLLPEIARTKNRTGKEFCRYCDQTGFVVWDAGDEKGYGETMAPCPYCEAGHRVEFPKEGVSHWGAEGFWARNDSDSLEAVFGEHPASPEENRRFLAELQTKMAGVAGPMFE